MSWFSVFRSGPYAGRCDVDVAAWKGLSTARASTVLYERQALPEFGAVVSQQSLLHLGCDNN